MSDETPILLPPAEDHSDRPKWRHWTWWLHPKVALTLLLFVLLLLSPFLMRASRLSRVPAIEDPFDVEAFLSETVDDKDNAFLDYNAAEALLVPATFSRVEWDEVDSAWEKTSPPVRAWVTANRPALDRWRTGTEKEHSIDNDLRRLDHFDSSPDVGRARDIARLACLQGEREQSEGQMAEAWQWYRALMRFSRHVGERTGAVGRIVGVFIHAETAKRIALWAGDPRTSAEELQMALNHLTGDFHLTRPFSEILKVEFCGILKLERLNDQWKLRSPFLPTSPSWSDSRFVMYCLGEPELTFRLHKLVIENWLSGSDVPRKLQVRIAIRRGCLLDHTAPDSRSSVVELQRLLEASPVRSANGFWFNIPRDRIDDELAGQEALRLTLACQFWFRRHGGFPAKLEDLVPDILAELPVDPFSQTGEGFRYRRDGDAVVVYSLGLDETDDHGSVDPIPGKDRPDIGYRLEPPRIREQVSEQKPVDEP